MRASFLLALACVLLAAAVAHGVLLSDRNYLPSSWIRLHRADPEYITTFSVFLKQRNVQASCPSLLDQISDPESPDYGKHLTREQILDRLAPSAAVQRQVIEWVKSAGINEASIVNHRDSLFVRAPVSLVERLFSTELHVYRRLEGKATVVRQWGTAHVADEVMQHIDLFTGIDDFPPPPRNLKTRPLLEEERSKVERGADSGYVIPETIRRIYKIPYSVATNPKSSVCLVEFQNDASFSKSDLTYFQTQTGEALNNVAKIVGPYNPSSPDAEASLDVQYAAAIADNTTVWYWTVTGWLLDFSQAFFNTPDVPLVVSMSWGWTENHQCDITNCNSLTSKQYVDRVNVEWCKIGLRGVSLFAASGDQGAPGDGDYDCSSSSDPLTPIFPGASPYVTSVGATMLVDSLANNNQQSESLPLAGQSKRATPPICQQFQCATVNTEGVCSYPDALITTGGGFSVYSPRPAWQQQQVTTYLNSGVALPPSQYFSANNRGFPDISALGHNYIIRLGGSWEVVDGTSCSSPVWAAITALLNDARLNAGKAPLGFIAPVLYRLFAANAAAFTSITTGNNMCTESCCASVGYVAGPAWDPVTGLGTPVYPTLLKYVMNLP